jgi:signal transduction histidine kinase
MMTHKHIEENYLNHPTLPTRQHWHTHESNRVLLEPRKQLASVVLILIAAGVLCMQAPLVWVVLWFLLSISLYAWMEHLTTSYSALLKSKLNLKIMTVSMARLVRKYKMAWTINCLVWCGMSFMSQMWLPTTGRLLCLAILNALMFLFIARTYVDRGLMHRVSAILLLSQFVFAVMRLVQRGNVGEVVAQVSVYIMYLLLMCYLLWSISNQFNLTHTQRLDSEYAKMQLIESLSRSQNQLQAEQQALIASNELVEKFYSSTEHDIRQPIYAMQLYTEMLSDDLSKNKILLPKITQSCIGINEILNTLFNTLLNSQKIDNTDIKLVKN